MITNEQLAEIKDYCAKATAGPWGLGEHHLTRLETDVTARSGEDWIADCGRLNGLRLEECIANTAFIAQARTDLPLLVAAYEEQGKELGLLTDNLKAFRAEHLRLEHLLGLAMQSAACTNGETILDGVQRIKRDVAGMESDLSAAQKRIERLSLALDAATNLGIYAQAVRGHTDPSLNYEQRTEFQNGWNAACIEGFREAVKVLYQGDWATADEEKTTPPQ